MDNSLDLYAMMSALQSDSDEETTTNQRSSDDLVELGNSLVRKLLSLSKNPETRISGPLQSISQLSISKDDFQSKYIETNLPVLLTDGTLGWRANEHWTTKELIDRFGKVSFSLYNGQEFPLQDYINYMGGRGEDDAEPFYLFEDLSTVSAEDTKYQLLYDYTVLPLFQSDLYSGIDRTRISKAQIEDSKERDQGVRLEEGRPRFRWLLIGPARSGTRLHADPLCTSAWNALLSGNKRWVLISPTISEETIEVEAMKALENASNELGYVLPKQCGVVDWFQYVLPHLKSVISPELLIECTQCAGETIFVPSGWWHIVINLNVTVAITENFASPSNFVSICDTLAMKAPVFFDALVKDMVLNHSRQIAQLHMKHCQTEYHYFLPPYGASIRKMRPGGASCLRMGVWSPNDNEWLVHMQRSYNRYRLRTALKQAVYGDFGVSTGNDDGYGVENGTQVNFGVENGTQVNFGVENGTQGNSGVENGTQGNSGVDNGTQANSGVENGTQGDSQVAGGLAALGIPKIMHHIWLGGNVPEELETIRNEWLKKHDTWEHKLWTDQSIKNEEVKLRASNAFFSASNYGEKSDILRYEVLEQHGGVYVDFDFMCTSNLDAVVEHCSFFAGQSNTTAVELNNGIIGASKQHPILEALVSGIASRTCHDVQPTNGSLSEQVSAYVQCAAGQSSESHQRWSDAMSTIKTTGPGYFTKTVMENLSNKPIPIYDSLVIFPPTFFYPLPNNVKHVTPEDALKSKQQETLAIHLWRSSWQT